MSTRKSHILLSSVFLILSLSLSCLLLFFGCAIRIILLDTLRIKKKTNKSHFFSRSNKNILDKNELSTMFIHHLRIDRLS